MTASDDLELFERSLRSATSTSTGPELDASLEELGWRDALAVDMRAAVSLLFQLQGEANATSSALDQLLAHAIGHRGTGAPAGVGGLGPAGRLTNGRLDRRRASAPRASRLGTTAIVVAARGDDTSRSRCRRHVAALARRSTASIRRSASLEVSGDVAAATEIGPIEWPIAVALGQLALGHELVGASRQMLELARQHALDRVQFGQPIARFQAVRHRLAETPRRHRGRRRPARRRVDRPRLRRRRRWRRRWRAGAPGPLPGTASRSSPASASRPSILFTCT